MSVQKDTRFRDGSTKPFTEPDHHIHIGMERVCVGGGGGGGEGLGIVDKLQ